MKVAEILRAIATIVDAVEQPQQEPEVQPEIEVVELADNNELEQIKQLAGMNCTTEPNEQVFPLSAAFPAGDDVHKSKNPADIRTNAPSMYPGYQASK